MSRLIDADELKKAIDTWDKFGYTTKGELIRLDDSNKDDFVPYVKFDDVCNCIDNAPTVFDENAYSQGYKQGTCDSKYDRPQGEWIDTGDMQEYWAEEYQCSICGEKDHWHNFCPNCGAKMKGGAE